MIRRLLLYSLFSLFAALTLALLLLTIRSFWVADVWDCQGADQVSPQGLVLGTYYEISSGRGRFYFVTDHQHAPIRYSHGTLTAGTTRLFKVGLADFRPIMFRPTHRTDYFVFQHGTLVGEPFISDVRDPTHKHDMVLERDIIVPAWAPLGLGAGISALLFFPIRRRWRTARRLRDGLCPNCGYDLGGEPTDMRTAVAQSGGTQQNYCPWCGGEGKHIPGGFSQKTQKDYSEFWVCKSCKKGGRDLSWKSDAQWVYLSHNKDEVPM